MNTPCGVDVEDGTGTRADPETEEAALTVCSDYTDSPCPLTAERTPQGQDISGKSNPQAFNLALEGVLSREMSFNQSFDDKVTLMPEKANRQLNPKQKLMLEYYEKYPIFIFMSNMSIFDVFWSCKGCI